MFSATLDHEVIYWCKLNLDNVVTIRIGAAQAAVETIDQKLVFCGTEHGKLVAFRSLVQSGLKPPVLVFVETKERAQQLFKELLYDGIHVDIIHSERSQTQRENTVRAFRSGGIWVLICTELMGRGIDFKGVNLVINYDFPPSAVSYIHRIGRTGRAGREGQAITYYTEADKPMLRCIANVMQNSGCEVPDFILAIKPSKFEKKKLKTSKRSRSPVSRNIKLEIANEKKKTAICKASKRRNQIAAGIIVPTSEQKSESKKPSEEQKPKMKKKISRPMKEKSIDKGEKKKKKKE